MADSWVKFTMSSGSGRFARAMRSKCARSEREARLDPIRSTYLGSGELAGSAQPKISASTSTPTGTWSEPITSRSMNAPRTNGIADGDAST